MQIKILPFEGGVSPALPHQRSPFRSTDRLPVHFPPLADRMKNRQILRSHLAVPHRPNIQKKIATLGRGFRQQPDKMGRALVGLVQRMITVRFVCRRDRLPILLLRFGHRTELQRSVGSAEVISVNRPGNPPINNQIGILFSEIGQNLLVQLLRIMMGSVPPKKNRMIVFNQLLDLGKHFLFHHRFAPFWPVRFGISRVPGNRPVLRMGVIETQLHPVLIARHF